MPDFRSMADIQKHFGSSAGANSLLGMSDVKVALQEAAIVLEKILHEEVQAYYDSYSPTVYKRTYDFLNSIRVSPITQDVDGVSISVYFDENMATHPSIFNGEPGFLPILLDKGWQWRNGIDIYHLSNYEGFHFVTKTIERFNLENKWGFRITPKGTYNGQDLY